LTENLKLNGVRIQTLCPVISFMHWELKFYRKIALTLKHEGQVSLKSHQFYGSS